MRQATRVACVNDGDCPTGESCNRLSEPLGFRDYNLDGMIDQGEVRPELSENYSVDSNPFTPNNGTGSNYPFNRSRLTEDVVEALDPSVGWHVFAGNNFVNNTRCCTLSTDTCAIDSDCLNNGVCQSGRWCCYPSNGNCGHCAGSDVCYRADTLVSGIVIVPSGSYNSSRRFPGAPSLNWPIHTEDTSSVPFFSDLVICSNCRDEPSAIAYAAHEYLHSWEGYPDLYDYDVFEDPGTAIINCPIGRWDIMASGGLVHPVPPLKENKSGWIESVNLKTVLTPGVERTLKLLPAELEREDRYFYLENDVADSSGELLGERYYFWSAGSGFDRAMPGRGLLILKTNDFRADSDALALQQRTDPFNFRIVQADGQNDLQSCSSGGNLGDAGDVWPGTSNATKFNFRTNPKATWQDGRWTGLDVTSVVPQLDGSILLTLKWEPTNIPSLKFIDPPGGGTVGSEYRIQYETTDVYGRTDITLYYTQNNDGIPNPSAATPIATRRKGLPGTVSFTHNWDTRELADGLYYLFAKLTPDTSVPPPPEGPEIRFTDPLPNRNNFGDGEIMNVILSNQSRLETWIVELVDPTNQEWVVSSSLTQPLPEEGEPGPELFATTGESYVSKDGVLQFDIVLGAIPFALGDTFTFKTTGITKFTASLRVEDGVVLTGPQPVIVATVEGAAPGAPLSGNVPLIVNFDTQGSIDPEGLPLTYAWDFGDGSVGAGSQVSHTYTESGVFTVTLRATNTVPQTGVATVDVTVINNSPSAVISADPTSGPAPLDVVFSAAGSSDLETQDPGDLAYQWDFGDGTTANSQGAPGLAFQTRDHRYETDEFGAECTSASTCLFIATLTVTDPGGASSTASIQISVGNSSPVADITVSPKSGDSPLTVTFDATGSTDVDGDDIEIIWDFGDGEPSPRIPVGTVIHVYETEGTYLATATLFDGRGGVTEWPGQSITVRTPVTPSSIPIARFEFDPAPPFEVGQEFKVVSTSVDRPNEATQLTHRWDFGDGTNPVEGLDLKEVTHTYSTGNEPGFTVTLIVTDDEGNSAQKEKPAVVNEDPNGGTGEPPEDENQPPTAVFVVNTNGDPVVEDQLVQFDASGSRDPEDGVLRYRWDFGDGSRAETGFGNTYVTRTHTYTEPGVYTVLLTVSDELNASADAMQQITVLSAAGNRPPVPILVDGPRVGAAPFTVQLDGRLSFDPDNDPLRFIWEFSDENGEIETFEENDGFITRTFDIVGTYMVVMKVDDGERADDELPFVTDEIRVTSPVVLPDPVDPGLGVPDDGPPAGSHAQRPSSVPCGFGMLTGLFVSLLGLSVMRLHRRRRGFLRS
ncbi:MAG: PKD domain-containing protein [Planctomycetes bacterium]|nr:PKD domain-containing protein [Planctomycetota bacterium]